jgi:hypothetical protein
VIIFTSVLKIETENGVIKSKLMIEGSNYSMRPKGFKKHLKDNGITLNKTETEGAYNLYNALKTTAVYELAVYHKPTAGSTKEAEDTGTETVDGVSPTKNYEFYTFTKQLEQNPQVLDDKTNGEGYGDLRYDGIDNNSNSSIGEKGTIIIDATSQTPLQTLGTLNTVTKKLPKQ